MRTQAYSYSILCQERGRNYFLIAADDTQKVDSLRVSAQRLASAYYFNARLSMGIFENQEQYKHAG